nr:MAG TPA: hypothetical protein [Caudoviricetes sp.]
MKDKVFETVIVGILVWSFVLLICITIMMFLPFFSK